MNALENKQEVSELVAGLSRAIDLKKIDDIMSVFSEDAVLELEEGGKTVLSLQGKEAIREHLSLQLEKYDLMFHNTGASVVELIKVDQSANAVTSSFVRTRTNDPIVNTDECLYYKDSMVKVEGCWYLVKHKVQIVSKSVR